MPVQSTNGAIKAFKLGTLNNSRYYVINARSTDPNIDVSLRNSHVFFGNTTNTNNVYIGTESGNANVPTIGRIFVQEQVNTLPTVTFSKDFYDGNTTQSFSSFDSKNSTSMFALTSGTNLNNSLYNALVFDDNTNVYKVLANTIRANTPNTNTPARYNPDVIVNSNNSVTCFFQEIDYISNTGTNIYYYGSIVNFTGTTVNAYKQIQTPNVNFSKFSFYQDNNNDYIIDGRSLTKIEANLNSIVWSKIGNNITTFYSVAIDSNNNIYAGSQENRVIKVDSNANVVWSKTSNNQTILYIFATNDSNVYLTGTDGNLISLDASTGNINWARTFRFSPNVNNTSIDIRNIKIKNNDLYVFGTYSYSNISQGVSFCAKVPADGTILGNGIYSLGGNRVMTYAATNITMSDNNITLSNSNYSMRDGTNFVFSGSSLSNTNTNVASVYGIPW